MELEKIPLCPEKSLAWGKGSQGLFSCCERATRDPGLAGGGLCGGAGYRCCRRAYTLWWQAVVYIFVFIVTMYIHWVSMAVFVAPEKVLPWYTFFFTVALFLKTHFNQLFCLLNLRAEADALTSKMRFASEGVDAIFSDEGQYLGFRREYAIGVAVLCVCACVRVRACVCVCQ